MTLYQCKCIPRTNWFCIAQKIDATFHVLYGADGDYRNVGCSGNGAKRKLIYSGPPIKIKIKGEPR